MSSIKMPPPTCNLCGKPSSTQALILIPIDGKWLQVCPTCYPYTFTCVTCQHNNDCGVKNDTSDTPKVIMATHHQGPMTVQQQEINPILIDKYCGTCRCNTQFGCRKMTPIDDDCSHWAIQDEILAKI